ncbi:RxLR effector candidate protein [Mycena sanguinolenta]|uniref:RxLR effector candidate protein n=1 Tax=Mycena sanguinolenta TaxID=230812 RepID=A0A8H6ZD01_9AGAR|nr:RxLR effector candidate protein [Mycena sanguinolenta]KAF7376770.1 RxLR effector candidate protein [Mycena sanguinolenta]
MMDSKADDAKGVLKLKDDTVYDDWEFQCRADLRKKGVLEIVLGNETRPQGSPNSKPVKAWITKRDVATAAIIGRLDPSQFAHVREFEEDPAGMWARLKEMYQSSSLGGVVVTWRQFYALRKPDDASTMRTHIAAVRGLAEKLGRLYNDKPSDAQIIATLLMSLPAAYDTLIISLDSHPERDNLEFVIGRLLAEEHRQEAEIGGVIPYGQSLGPTNAMTARVRRDRSQITCFKCRKVGHFQNECPEPGPLVENPFRSTPEAGTPPVIAATAITHPTNSYTF